MYGTVDGIQSSVGIVTSVEVCAEEEQLYDIGVVKNHNFFADGVLVHNCHRFSKSQQDVLLPVVEDGTIILFGATTEKPKFAVNSTILSRCLVFEVKNLDNQAMLKLLIKIKDHYKNKGKQVKIDQDAAKTLLTRCSGDARKLITSLETAVEILSEDGHVTLEHVNYAIPEKHLIFDATGNEHFDSAAAYQNCIQNSDADGAIYWLAQWLLSGEDPAYISRRMLVTSFEDCASNFMVPMVAMAASYAVERVGPPECYIPMGLATIIMAQSQREKTGFYAINGAISDVVNKNTVRVPNEMRAGIGGYVKEITKSYVNSDLIEKFSTLIKEGKREETGNTF